MHRSLDALLFRGLLGTALSIAAVTAAATQAPRFELEMNLDDGRLVLIEFRKESGWVPIREDHKMTVREARIELEAEGYRFDRVIDVLPWQHILVFIPGGARPEKGD